MAMLNNQRVVDNWFFKSKPSTLPIEYYHRTRIATDRP